MRPGKEERTVYVNEGMNAFVNGAESNTCPYEMNDWRRDRWLHGWWKALYEVREGDRKKIADWLLDNLVLVIDENQAAALAYLLTSSGNYNHTKPIEGNRLCGVEFTVPAPNTL